ncbi:MAG: DUF4340 domain-containing protein [Clostridiales bacterium]|nr:DUF4340 domain-containing protein [Clostridiales bacterium]
MSKRLRTLIIVIVVLALLGGSFTALLLLPGPEQAESSTPSSKSEAVLILDKALNAQGGAVDAPVKSAVIRSEDKSFTLEPDSDGILRVAEYGDLPVHTTRVEALVRALTSVSAIRQVTEEAENPADFGLAEPRATAEVTYHDDSTAVLELGGEDPMKEGVYLRIQGESPIYLVTEDTADTIFHDSLYYIGTALITAPPVREEDTGGEAMLRDMKLTGSLRADQPLSFRRTAHTDTEEIKLFTYVITSPYIRSFNDDMLRSLLTNATSLTASIAAVARPTEEELEKYGFHNPYSVAELNLAVLQGEDASSDSAENDETPAVYYNVQPHRVVIGSRSDSGSYYVMVDDMVSIYEVSASALPWAEAVYENSVNTSLFRKNITDVAAVSITTAGEETRFELTHFPDKETPNEQLTITHQGETLPTDNFRSLYQVLMLIKRNGKATGAPAGEPHLTLTVTPTDSGGSAVTAVFYEATASQYLCRLQDGDTFMVNASAVENLLTQMKHYLAGEDVKVSLA